MSRARSTPARRLLVPEVIQTSGMDCGPASLKALLEGFGIPVHYSRLREACQTDIDGTSIDVIEDVASKLGLSVGQFIVPLDHLLMDEAEALPGMVVTLQPNGLSHFVVAWRTHGRFTQVMDPGAGRLFKTRRQFLSEVYAHRFPVPREVAHEWFTASAFLAPLRRRVAGLGSPESDIDDFLGKAQSTDDWLPLAALDAATRLATRLVSTGALKSGASAVNLMKRLAAEAERRGAEAAFEVIPSRYWSAAALPSGDVELRGAVILHAEGRTTPAEAQGEPQQTHSSPELAAALAKDGKKPLRSILDAALVEYRTWLVALPVALFLAGSATGLEALVLSGLSGIRASTGIHSEAHRLVWGAATFLFATLLLNISVTAVLLRVGRWLDVHLRIRLLDKLPRLGNYYFHSRLGSDLAQRAHELRSLRRMPSLLGSGLRLVSEILVTAACIVWLVPSSTLPVLVAVLFILGLPIALFPRLREQDLRRETHVGALTRFHLDSLLGLMPIKAHRAEQAVRAEHEALLVKWAKATREFYWTHLAGLAAGLLAGTLFAIWALNHSMVQGGRREFTLLVVYWSLKLPLLSQELGHVLRQLPRLDNRLGRLFDILSGPEETEAHAHRGDAPAKTRKTEDRTAQRTGVSVLMRGVSVHAGGHRILSDVDLELLPGEHVAIVGPSGSGKTSLVGLLLGWHRAASGSVFIDGELAEAEQIQRLRHETAWVDPAVQIWNRSFEQNLLYGNGDVPAADMQMAVEGADLTGVLERLPESGNSILGEGGGFVSGGEGQRVRFARALLRPKARLVILDEPFRGLDHEKRRELLAAARRHFRGATLVYVSHDIDAALDFDRVLVVEDGRLVEDSAPGEPAARLNALKQAQEAAQQEVWRNPVWRRWWMEGGTLREAGKEIP